MAATAAELAFLLGEGSASLSPEGAATLTETALAGASIAVGATSYVYSKLRTATGGEGRKVMKMTPSKTPRGQGNHSVRLTWLAFAATPRDYAKKKKRKFYGRFRRY